MSVHTLIPKHGRLGEGFSRAQQMLASEDAGRPWTRAAGGWVTDLASSQKFVMLCPYCVHKFSPRRYHYEEFRQHVNGVGKCDGCKNFSTYLRGFIHEHYHDTLGDWERPRRRGRWARRH